MAAARTVTVIPATINPRTRLPAMEVRKRRVAGYARVSTDKDEQFTSYEAQIDYYTQMIQKNPEWEFVDVYTDEGISGTNTKHREGFNTMVADALAGRIDLIVTKSVSRFARNTVDSLVTIRKLKEAGCECFFEKEGIYTFDGKGELLLTIMSSLAQEESRSISENVTWGQRKRFADGKVSFGYSSFLGYDRGAKKGDPPVINEEQAVIVRRIYKLFMEGKTTWMIAQILTKDGIPTPRGNAKWAVSTVESILTNEKYKGAAILQKTFTVDFLTKTMKTNEGEVPQYYVENSHPAIIDPDEWEIVQNEFARRKALGRRYSGNSILASRIVCGECGEFYGAKVWNSNNPKYRRTIWQCNGKFKGDHNCTTPHLTEDQIKEQFVAAVNDLLKIRKEVIANCEAIRDTLTDCTSIDEEIESIIREIEVVTELTRRIVEDNARTAQDQTDYLARYNEYCERYNALAARVNELQQEREARMARGDGFNIFIKSFKKLDCSVAAFDDRLWQTLLETVTVQADGKLIFKFNNGMTVEK